MKTGAVFDIKKYAIHDGPGIRTTVFLKGCPLRCWWCHNPEGQESQLELVYRKTRCIGCHECIRNCKREAVSPIDRTVSVDREKCSFCGCCVQSCPSGALSTVGKLMSVQEVMEEVEKDRPFYEESGGGVTFSGGEPFLQLDFLKALLIECGRREIHVAVGTCGFVPYNFINEMRDKIDLFLFDVKIMDDVKHKKYTGASNRMILRNIESLAKKGSRLVISLPVVPNVNDDDQNITAMAEFLNPLPNVEQVSLLPYHRAGIEKYRSLGKPYRLEKTQPPTESEVMRIKSKLEACGLKVEIGGG